MRKIKEKVKNGKIIFFLYQYCMSLKLAIKNSFATQPNAFKKLKGKYADRRCFIIATGPSLTIDDLNLIKGEYSFGVNSIMKSFEMTEWRPNFYLMTDPVPYHNFIDCVRAEDFEYVFFPKDLKDKKIHHIDFNRNNAQLCKARAYNRYYKIVYPSKKIDKYLNDANSCIFSAIQIAAYLGFKQIFLIGQDCSFDSKKQHSSVVDPGYTFKVDKSTGELLIDCFKNYKEFYDLTDIHIYNCTRGGALEVFDRKRLEEILK